MAAGAAEEGATQAAAVAMAVGAAGGAGPQPSPLSASALLDDVLRAKVRAGGCYRPWREIDSKGGAIVAVLAAGLRLRLSPPLPLECSCSSLPNPPQTVLLRSPLLPLPLSSLLSPCSCSSWSSLSSMTGCQSRPPAQEGTCTSLTLWRMHTAFRWGDGREGSDLTLG